MTKQNKTIPIFFAVDDNYVPHLCVALRSLIDNCSKKYDYQINILIDSLSDESRHTICEMQTDNIKVAFVSVEEKLREICARLHMRDYYTKATYYRFFIPEIFSQYDKGIYLDCDIVITDDISKLYNCHLGHNLAAAIPDEVITDIEVFAQYSENVLALPRRKYFNAGIMVMNLEEMRKFRIEERFAEILNQRTFSVAQDQDYLNVLCRNRILYLSKSWNKTPMPDSDLSVTPHIVHYKINFKPWRYDNIPYAELFWEYAAKTSFYDYFVDIKNNYSDSEKQRDSLQYDNLIKLATEETEAACQADDGIAICAEVI